MAESPKGAAVHRQQGLNELEPNASVWGSGFVLEAHTQYFASLVRKSRVSLQRSPTVKFLPCWGVGKLVNKLFPPPSLMACEILYRKRGLHRPWSKSTKSSWRVEPTSPSPAAASEPFKAKHIDMLLILDCGQCQCASGRGRQ
eukprot:5032122-Amphidinium_carterae.1